MSVRGLNISLASACLLVLALGCGLGSTPMPFGRVLAALIGNGSAGDMIVVWDIRLPRGLAALFVGAALAGSGAALQGLLRNPLAEPGVLGVSAMAALGATFVLYYGLTNLSPVILPLAAITGAVLATMLIAAAAIKAGSVVTLILIGVALSSFAGAVMALLMNLAPNPFYLSDMANWSLGSVANRSLADLALAVPFIAAGLIVLFLSRRGLSILTLGEAAAFGAGLDVKKQRILTVLGAGLATGGAVSLAGAIGFVGIVAPHLIRPLTGHDPARSLLPSALLGGLILMIADIGIRLNPAETELKLGVVAALIGAPIFAWIAVHRTGNTEQGDG